MSKQITIEIHVTVAEEADPDTVGGSLFDLLCQLADEDLIESVDGYDPKR